MLDSFSEMPVHLHRRITLDGYEREFGFNRFCGWRERKWAALRTEIESELAAGGELWMWEYQSDLGLTGTCGLAVVRNDSVARKWKIWG